MEDDEDDKQILERIAQHLELEDTTVQEVISLLYGPLPDWFPAPSLDRARRIIQHFLNDGFNPELIGRFVDAANTDSPIVPGTVTDVSAFYQYVYELGHIRFAISLGKSKGLRELAGELAEYGQKFKDGRKPGAGGAVRKVIAKLLAKNPEMKNPELWDAIKLNPPKGWRVEEPRYFAFEPAIIGPNQAGDHMSRRRFFTVCGEERKKLKAKNTG